MKPSIFTFAVASLVLLCSVSKAHAQEAAKPAAQPAFTDAQIATMRRIMQAAGTDDYAYEQLRILTQRIGPRLTAIGASRHRTSGLRHRLW